MRQRGQPARPGGDGAFQRRPKGMRGAADRKERRCFLPRWRLMSSSSTRFYIVASARQAGQPTDEETGPEVRATPPQAQRSRYGTAPTAGDEASEPEPLQGGDCRRVYTYASKVGKATVNSRNKRSRLVCTI